MPDDNNNKVLDLESMWPQPNEKLFVEAGAFRGAWVAKNADERLYRMINGFREAGDLLVFEARAEPHRSQNLIFPIVFSYRQSLELQLKYLLMAYGPTAGEAPDFTKHSLVELWSKCRRMILFFEGGLRPADKQTFKTVEEQITEFDALDSRSDSFRFAHARNGRSIKLKITEIDLTQLQKVVGSLFNFLECVDCHLRYRITGTI